MHQSQQRTLVSRCFWGKDETSKRMSPSQVLNQWKNWQKLCKMRKQWAVRVPFGHCKFHETIYMLVAAGSKETPPPAVRKRCGGWGLLITSSHHHLNHAKSISCLVNFTSWFPAVSPLNFHGAYICENGDNRTRGWCGPTTLRNSYTCAMSVRTDPATKGTLLPFSFQQICSKGAWIWMLN